MLWPSVEVGGAVGALTAAALVVHRFSSAPWRPSSTTSANASSQVTSSGTHAAP